MRFEIKEIQKEYGITVMYVTHDQTEAMAMSDRIVVIVSIRPEQIQYVADGEGDLTGTVKSHFYLGDVDDCRVDLGGGKELRVIADPYMSMGVSYGKKVSLKVRNFHAFPLDESAGDFRKILT